MSYRQFQTTIEANVSTSNAIVARRFVKKDDAETAANDDGVYIEQCNTSGEVVDGVALQAVDAADADTIDVDANVAPGITLAEAGAAVTAGSVVQTDASGRAITRTGAGRGVAKALDAASAAGDIIRIQFGNFGTTS